MTAQGKIVTAQIRPGDRVLVVRTDTAGVVVPATRKTGAVATTVREVTKLHAAGSGHFHTVGRRTRYRISTTAGDAMSAPAQTFWRATPTPPNPTKGATPMSETTPETATTPETVTPAAPSTLVDAVKAHATEHYNDANAAWDVVIETMDDAAIAEVIGKARTAASAVRRMREHLAPYASKRADIEATADTETAPKPAPVKVKAVKAAPTPPADLPAGIPADAPGASKAARLFVGAAEANWTATAERDGATGLVVTLTGGPSTIVVTFADGKLDLGRMPSYTANADAKPRQLKNVSAALAVLAANPAPAAPPAAKPARKARKGTPQPIAA